ncbi:hypothetical protein BKA61DRAFT_614848, partial [Leptodontidium sp. MPI-SDFR-AT-0119]
MSSIEAVGLALGMISAIISIVNATIKIYEATAFTLTLEDYKAQATQLRELFAKVILKEGKSRWDRYVKVARTIRKGSRVEDLVRGILDDLQLLATSFPE